MNFQQLEYVLAVDQHKHFGKAAESCHVTQATLSAMIKKLEEELGYPLFDRSHKPVQTTDLGREFITLAGKMLATRNQMQQLGTESADEISGSLRVGVIPTIANTMLPMLLPPLLKENPNLELNISEVTTEEIIQQLLTDQLDVGLLATPLENEQLEETVLFYEPMMVYGVTDDAKQYVTSDDIKQGKIWLLEEGHCFRNQAVTICDMREDATSATNLNFEGGSFETLLSLTDRFGGYTLIPELYYNTLPKKRQKLAKPFQKPIPVREISLVSYRPYTKQRTIHYLSEFIRELMQDHLSTAQYANHELEIIGI